MRGDQSLDVRDSRPSELDLRQSESELVERDRLAGARLFAPDPRSLDRSGDPAQQGGHRSAVDVGLVDRSREERAGECSFLHVRLLGHAGELGRLLRPERDVQARGIGLCHYPKRLARIDTTRV